VVAVGISLIGIAAGMTLLIGTHRWFRTGVSDRGTQETARIALDEIGLNLRRAGYGLELGLVFDMGVLAPTVIDQLPQANKFQGRFGGYGCGGPGVYGDCPELRDSVTGPDELVFYARDPMWSRDVTQVLVGGLVLAKNPAGRPTELLQGQVLQVMCYGAANQWLWSFVTVQSAVEDATQVQVTLAPATGDPYDFPFQQAVLGEPCFAAAGAPPSRVRAYKVDRFRYHVLAVDDAGNVQAWGTVGARPYLMLDQGLRDADGVAIDRVIAPDVEDLQVAYVFPSAPAGSQVLGANEVAGVVATTDGNDTGFNLRPAVPFAIPSFATPPSDIDLARTTHHPANIRAVRVAITVRDARQDENAADASAVVPAALNRPEVSGPAGYRRAVFETTTYTRNLEARAPVFPIYDSQANALGDDACRQEEAICTTDPCPLATTGNCGGG
jgi:hypothetical protein